MIASGIARSFLLELFAGLHHATDEYRCALYTDAAQLSEDSTSYVTQGEAVTKDREGNSTGYKAGGQTLTGYATSLVDRQACLSWNPPLWPNASITARGAMIFNFSSGGRAVAVFELMDAKGKPRTFTSTNGDFLVQIPTMLLRIG